MKYREKKKNIWVEVKGRIGGRPMKTKKKYRENKERVRRKEYGSSGNTRVITWDTRKGKISITVYT